MRTERNPFAYHEAQVEAQRRMEARQSAMDRFGQSIGSALDNLVNQPDSADEQEMKLAEDVFSGAVVSGLQSGDRQQAEQAISAVVHLARTFSPRHNHREVRIK